MRNLRVALVLAWFLGGFGAAIGWVAAVGRVDPQNVHGTAGTAFVLVLGAALCLAYVLHGGDR